MNLIIAAIILIVVGAVLYGIYALLGRAVQGVPLIAAGIILLLIFLAVALYLFGYGKRIADRNSLNRIPVATHLPIKPSI
jgi:drug/metabolite transporter (DMT)-like permease